MRLGDLSVGFAQCLQETLVTLGHDPKPLYAAFELSPTRLAQAGARLSIARYMRLGHAAITLSRCPALGLHMGRYSRLEHLGLAGLCASQAPNVRAAARCLTEFELLYAQNYLGRSQLLEDSTGAWLRFYSIAPYNPYNFFVVDAVLRGWQAYLSQVAAQPLKVTHVQIEYPAPPYAEQFEAFFACPVEFSAPHNQLRLSLPSLSISNPKHCPHSYHELHGLCQQQLTSLQRPLSYTEHVSQLLAPLLRQGEPQLHDIAQRLKLPPWTLQRRLAAEGTTFRQLLQDTRYSLASSYLRDTVLSFAEIAWLLGFSCPEALQRAFKRWSGRSLGAFRQQTSQR